MPTREGRALIAAFWRNPFGPHGAASPRRLIMRRSGPARGEYVVVRRKPQREWVLGGLGARGRPVEVRPEQRFSDLTDTERDIFARRWQERFSEDIG